MTYSRYRVIHTPRGSAVSNEITELVSVNSNQGIKTTKDTFGFTVAAQSNFNNFFEVDDNIKIYLWNGNDSETLVMDGYIDSFQYKGTVDNRVWQIAGASILERMLSVQVPVNSQNKNAGQVVKDIVDRVNQQSLRGGKEINYVINGVDRFGDADSPNTISTTKSDGAALATIALFTRSTPTTAMDMVQELSMPTLTGDVKSFYFYLDTTTNKLNFKPKLDNPAATELVEGDNILTWNIEKSVFDVVNAVIINGGRDFNGHSILDRYYNITSVARYGMKMRYFNIPKISEQRKLDNNITINNDFPNGKEADYSGGNAQFRNDVRADVRNEGRKITDVLGIARFKGSVTMRGNTSFTYGDIVTVKIKNVFIDVNGNRLDQLRLRITDIEHALDTRNGWVTTLKLEEDEKAVTGAVA